MVADRVRGQATVTLKWRTLLLLALAELLAMSLWFSASAVLPALLVEWRLHPAEGAWLTMAVQVGFVAGSLAVAVFNLADRFPPAAVVALGAAGGAVVNALIPLLAGGLALAVPLRFLTGFALAAVYPVGMRLMATWTREDRGLALGLLVGALTVGSAAPHLVRALGGIAEWRRVLYAVSVLALLGAAIVWRGVPVGPHAVPAPRLAWAQFAAAWRDRPLRLANLGYFGHMWELYAMWTWLPAFLAASYHATAAAATPLAVQRYASLVTFAAIAAGGAGSLLWGWLGDRWGRTRSTILSLAISGACAALVALTYGRAPSLAALVALVWGFAVVADSAQFSTAASELCDPAYIGTALAAMTAIGFLLTMGSIQLLPFIAERIGWQWTFAVLVPGPALGALAMDRLRRTPAAAARLAGGRG
jgi:MFS family permease